jgi:hypothetical protein
MLDKNIVKIIIAVLIIVILFRMLRGGSESFDPMDADFVRQATVPPGQQTTGAPDPSRPTVTLQPAQPTDVSTMAPMTTSVDLLPKPNSSANTEFGEFAPTKALEAQNFVDATKMIGVDTVGSSLRNASYDLRRSPTIPRSNVGPWQQSTVDADLYRKTLDC